MDIKELMRWPPGFRVEKLPPLLDVLEHIVRENKLSSVRAKRIWAHWDWYGSESRDEEAIGEIAARDIRGVASAALLLGSAAIIECRENDRHLLQLDFKCRPTLLGLRRVAWWLFKAVREPGYVVHSGQSFHFWGERMLPYSKWQSIIFDRCLSSSPVDRQWLSRSADPEFGFLFTNPETYLRITELPFGARRKLARPVPTPVAYLTIE